MGNAAGKREEEAAHLTHGKQRENKQVFGESVDLDDDFKAPVFPKSDTVRSFLKESLSGNLIHEFLSNNARDRLISAMQIQRSPCGIGIIQQGDIGDYFYVVEEGTVAFVVDGVKVGSCTAGSCFGELALLYDCPRAATCLAETETVLWKVDRTTFQQMIVNIVKKESQGIREVLKNVSFLSGLDDSTITQIADALTPMSCKKDKRIVEKGEIGKVFYIIKSGTLKLHDIGSGESQFADHNLGPGDFFGERALICGEPRAANCTAVTDCEMLCLTRELFNTTIGNGESLFKNSTRQQILSSVTSFSDANLEQHEIKAIIKLFKEQVFSKGAELIREGEPLKYKQGIYIVEDGHVRIMDSNGTITKLQKGDHFGGQTIKDGEDSVSDRTILFLQNTTCAVLSKKDIETVIPISRLGVAQSFSNSLTDISLYDLTLYRVLGAGSFGKVRLVSHNKTKKPYALKILSKVQILQCKQSKAVIREKNIMASIRHPLIVELFAVFQDENHLYLALDLVQGGELFSVIHSKSNRDSCAGVDFSSAQFYAACILECLSYLHHRYICYRDLKPENILIGKEGYCKLIDFGFAKVVVDKTYTLCGTPEYLAPEILLSKGHSKGVDYWGLGVLIYELLAGYTPFFFANRDQVTMYKMIIKSKFTFPETFASESKDIIKRLLVRQQSRRFGCLANQDIDVRQHVFFSGISFRRVYQKKIQAPWLPKIKGDLDPSNYRTYSNLETDEETPRILTPDEQAQFGDF